MGKCLKCAPVVRSTSGGDHTGRDFFLCCPKCRARTTHHVEGYTVTPTIEKMLRREWRAGRVQVAR